jgi:hypothetical protein
VSVSTSIVHKPWLLMGRRGGSTAPTLDLPFLGGVLDPRITFTRASVGTYFDAAGTLQTVGNNVPRFDYDPVTHAPLGLLIEEARTNLALQGNSLSGWTLSSATLTGNAGVGPDGTNSFNRVAETAVTNFHTVYVLYTVTASTTYSYSVFAKAAELRYLQLIYDDGGANGIFATFDLQTGTVSGAATARGTATLPSATISAAGSGIYRCTVSGQTPSTSGRTLIATSNAAAPGFLPSYAGNAANGLLAWGAQLEIGAFPTSYIPTTGATVTRQGDFCRMPTGGWYSSTVGSMASDFVLINTLPGRNSAIMAIDDGVGNRATVIDQYAGAAGAGNDINSFVRTASTSNASVADKYFLSGGVLNKTAMSWNAATLLATANGDATGQSSAVTGSGIPVVNRLLLGGTGGSMGGVLPLCGWYRRFRYWPRALSNAELQAATA